MRSHKRYITKDGILSNIHDIDGYINADALVMDSWSSKFVNDLKPEERPIRKKIKDDLRFSSSGCPNNHPLYPKLESIAESLIKLKTDPDWTDIHFVQSSLGRFEVEFEDQGKWDILREKAIKSIIEYYDSISNI